MSNMGLKDFEIDGDRLVKYKGNSQYVVVPGWIKEIGASAFEGCRDISVVKIQSGVASIGDRAFFDCGFCTVVVPRSVVYIGEHAFEMPYVLFRGTSEQWDAIDKAKNWIADTWYVPTCLDDTEFFIQERDGSYGLSLYIGTSEKIVVPNIEDIYPGVFIGCDFLKSITFPSSVTFIGTSECGSAYGDCPNLEELIVDGENPVYYSQDNCVIERESKRLVVGCKTSVIPNDVTCIGDYAFSNTPELKAITIPVSVVRIEGGAFDRCPALTAINYTGTKEQWGAVEKSFGRDDGVGDYTVHCSDGDYVLPEFEIKGTTLIKYNGHSKSVVIPDGVAEIGERAFWGHEDFTEITIPKSVTKIGKEAFYGTNTRLTINYLGTMEDWFKIDGKDNLLNNRADRGDFDDDTVPGDCVSNRLYIDGKEIAGKFVIPEGITYIGEDAFLACRDITSIVFPASLKEIGDGAFDACTGLKKLTVPVGVKTGSAFSDCAGLTEVVIPRGVTEISPGLFAGCRGLKKITIPDTVTAIGHNAFYMCEGLTEINIPSSVQYIGDEAFLACGSLESVTIPEGVQSIGVGAFAWCIGLKSISLPASVTALCNNPRVPHAGAIPLPEGKYSPRIFRNVAHEPFGACDGIESITVAKGNPVYHNDGNCIIETKSKRLLLGCKNSVIPDDGSVNSIGNYAFCGIRGATEITIPISVTAIGCAFYNSYGVSCIIYRGTKAQWTAVRKDREWDSGLDGYTVRCTDGDIVKEAKKPPETKSGSGDGLPF